MLGTTTEQDWATRFHAERIAHRQTKDWASGLVLDNAHLRHQVARLERQITELAAAHEVDTDTIAELRHEIDGGNR